MLWVEAKERRDQSLTKEDRGDQEARPWADSNSTPGC